MNKKIEIQGLKKSFGEKKVLQGLDLEVFQGEVLCIIGKSGSGKSVIMKHLVGLLEPDEGEIRVDGQPFTGADEQTRENIQKKYAILFQGAALFDSMNIYDNVAFGMRRKGLPESDIATIVPDLLAQVGLRDVEEKSHQSFPGGCKNVWAWPAPSP
jgi:phospholipid/cholesterol/gamma-HCH transport system ATP-binding protein